MCSRPSHSRNFAYADPFEDWFSPSPLLLPNVVVVPAKPAAKADQNKALSAPSQDKDKAVAPAQSYPLGFRVSMDCVERPKVGFVFLFCFVIFSAFVIRITC